MRDVANLYVDIRKRYAPAPAKWERLTSFLRVGN
jgi:hypothetical protein